MDENYKPRKYNRVRMEKRKKRVLQFALPKIILKVFLCICLICFIISLPIIAIKIRDDNINILNYINENYTGSFTIVSKSEDKRGIEYIIKDKDGVEFEAFKSKKIPTLNRHDNYIHVLIGKFANEYLDKNPIENVVVSDSQYLSVSHMFNKKTINLNLNSYLNIEDAVNTLYTLNSYVINKLYKYVNGNHYFASYIVLNDIKLPVNTTSTIEQNIYNCKVDYVTGMQFKELRDNDVTENDIALYWRPSSLVTLYNGKAIRIKGLMGSTSSVSYYDNSLNDKQYHINIKETVSNIPGVSDVSIVTSSVGLMTTDDIVHFKYKDKEYVFYKRYLSKWPNAEIFPTYLSESEFKEFFNANIERNYSVGALYITFNNSNNDSNF